MKEQIEQILAAEIRPMLEQDGGGIDLIGVNESTGEVKVKLIGACQGCPFAAITLKTRVEALLKEKVSDIVSVVSVE